MAIDDTIIIRKLDIRLVEIWLKYGWAVENVDITFGIELITDITLRNKRKIKTLLNKSILKTPLFQFMRDDAAAKIIRKINITLHIIFRIL